MHQQLQLKLHVVASVIRVKEYIDEHPLENKTTSQLAEYVSLNRNLLQKSFRELNGCNIKSYYTNRRMHQAKQLLADGMPIKQVANLCNYRSQSAFTTAFKNKYGTSPMIWLNEITQLMMVVDDKIEKDHAKIETICAKINNLLM